MESSEKNNERIMKVICLKQIEKERIKIEKIDTSVLPQAHSVTEQDYYELFVKMLKTEDEELQLHEHLWVLGIDERGYSVCLYVVSLGYANFPTIHPMKIFKFALQADAVKIIIAQSKPNKSKLILDEVDFDIINAIYHKAASLELELYDHIIISNLSIESDEPIYYSYIEHNLIEFISQDITHKTVKESREELDKERAEAMEYGIIAGEIQGLIEGEILGIDKGFIQGIDKGKREEKINMAKSMLADNMDINIISKHTGLTVDEIQKIKEDMGL